MVGQALKKSIETFRGIRPLNPARDLTQIGRLLSHTFRDEFDGDMAWMRMPILREVAAYVWAASFMPAMPYALGGFVWEEAGRIVGNMTITPDESRAGQWVVSNVAVEDEFRRRGIARALMQAALHDLQERKARVVILQVRPQNTPAIRLYQQLGFEIVDTATRYRRSSSPPTPRPVRGRGDRGEGLRQLEFSERALAYELAKISLPPRLQMIHPLPPSAFAITWEDRITEWVVDFLSGQQTTRWGMFNEGRLDAVITIRGQRLGSPHVLEIFVRPEARGNLESWMVGFALDQLSEFAPRPIQIEVRSSHGELVNTVQAQGFFAQKGLTLMMKEIGN